VGRVWMVTVVAAAACSSGGLDSAAQDDAGAEVGRELIPAEWTVAEDTSSTGEVTTASLQLPAARDIAGLLQDESPRLVLRCLEGRVAAFIDTDPVDGAGISDSGLRLQPVPIELDAAPLCE
jgi:hypothetical protein